jgi:dienelactone hydrolase
VLRWKSRWCSIPTILWTRSRADDLMLTELRLYLLLLVALCQAFLLLWVAGVFPRSRQGLKGRLAVFGAAQFLAVLMLLVGGDLELAYRWFGNFTWRLTAHAVDEFEPTGDPSLVARIGGQDPILPRPDLDHPALLRGWGNELRAHLREDVFGMADLAGAPPPFEVLKSEELEGGIRRRFVSYRASDGTSIPGYLFEPAERRPLPAVLVISGHGEGIIQTAGLVDSYQHGAAYELSRAGYVTFTPELRGFGYLGPAIGNEHNFTAYNALLAGTFYKAVLVDDLVLAMNLLLSLPSVDSSRVAVTGVSFGGEMSVTYAALDPRVRVVVAQGWSGEAVGRERGVRGGFLEFNQHLCHMVPGHNRYLLGEDWFLLVAPRPLLIVRGDDDFDPRDPVSIVRQAYGALGRPDAFQFTIMPGGHEYFVEPAVRFLNEHLRPAATGSLRSEAGSDRGAPAGAGR